MMDYIGKELELFAAARNWKSYFTSELARYLGMRVAEVGAGIGSTTLAFAATGNREAWWCIEPDRSMADTLEGSRASQALPGYCHVFRGVLADLPPAPQFDTILYIDVLEHIEHDEDEMRTAAERLLPGGRIIVLAPAWQHLFSDFDRSIGHHRRYSKASLARFQIAGLQLEAAFYLDAMGYLASLANRILLRQSMPTPSQIDLWDNRLVPVSRWMDRLIFNQIGKSVICVWQLA